MFFALQLYWNHTSVWVLHCKFAAYFQYTFLQEHLWRTVSTFSINYNTKHPVGDVLENTLSPTAFKISEKMTKIEFCRR